MIIKKLHAWLQSFYPLLLFTSTLFFFLPLYIYYTNSIEFALTGKTIVIVLTIITLVSSLVFSLASSLLPSRISKFISSLLTIISIAFWIQAYVLSWNYGVLDGTEINWGSRLYEGLIDGLIWLCIIIIGIKYQAVVYKYVKSLVVGLLIIQSVSLISVAWNAPPEADYKNYEIDESTKFQFSDKENVIILVLDTFQSDFFAQIIKEHPEYIKQLDGFTYFPNTVGGFPNTYPAIPLILTGQYYDNITPIQQFIKESFTKQSVFKLLKDIGYRTEAYPLLPYSLYYADSQLDNIQPSVYRLDRTTNILSSLWKLSLFRSTPTAIKPTFSKSTGLTNGEESPVEAVDSRKNIKFIQDIQSKISTKGSAPTFKFYHLPGTHAPYLMDANLQYRTLPYDKNGYHEIALGTTEIITKFLSTLKEKGIYENSTIIITGDHGAGIKTDSTKHYPMPDYVQPRAVPLLLFKPKNSKSAFTTSTAPAALEDVYNTIKSAVSDATLNNKEYSLQSITENTTRQRSFFWWMSTKRYTINGPVDEPSSWEIDHPSYILGTPINFGTDSQEAENYKREGWELPDGNFTWTKGNQASLSFKGLPQSQDLILQAQITPYLSSNTNVPKEYLATVRLNQEGIGQWHINKDGTYHIILPQELLNSEDDIVTLDLPDGIRPIDYQGLGQDPRALTINFRSVVINAPKAYEYNQTIDFTPAQFSAEDYLGNGWGEGDLEPGGKWTVDTSVDLIMTIPGGEEKTTLKATLMPYLHSTKLTNQLVQIEVNDHLLGEWTVDKLGEYTMPIPSSVSKNPTIHIRFSIPTATIPSMISENPDIRKLGVLFKHLTISTQ